MIFSPSAHWEISSFCLIYCPNEWVFRKSWLKQQLREEDIIARYGGDEFVVLVENIPLTKAQSIGQKIIQTTSRITKEKLPNHSSLGCSVGITQLTKNSLSINSVLKKADDACYKAKKNHGNTIWVDDNIPASFLDW